MFNAEEKRRAGPPHLLEITATLIYQVHGHRSWTSEKAEAHGQAAADKPSFTPARNCRPN
jgi:hypothetical protein